MGVMYKILKMFEWTDTESCIVQLLRILPSIRQPPQHLKVAARPATHPPNPPSLIPTSKMPPSPSSPTPSWTSCLAPPQRSAPRAAEAKSSRSSVSFHLFRQRFANKQNGPAIPFPRRRIPPPRRRLSSSLHPPPRRHGTVLACPVCGASYVHIIIREALVFGFAPMDGWMDGWNG